MGPDRNNYEIWLIDYLDGALDNERSAMLFAFLDENPDLKEEFSDLAQVSLKPAPDRFRNRESLKKVATEMDQRQFEMLCVAGIENDLDEEQRSELEEIISSDTEKRITYDAFRKIKLKAPSYTFRYKSGLKKLSAGAKIFRYSLTLVSSAAAILIMIIVLKGPVNIPGTGTVAFTTITSPVITVTPSPGKVAEKASPQSNGVVNTANALNYASKEERKNIDPEIQPVVQTAQNDPLRIETNRSNNIEKIACSEEAFSKRDNETRLAEINISTAVSDAGNEGKGPGKTIEKFIREKVIKPEEPGRATLKAYDVADAGVKGLKKLFGWNISLQKNRDAKGEVRSVSFTSSLVSFNAPVKKSSRLP